MQQFHQHPDGLIYLRSDGNPDYADTLVNFSHDYGQAPPALPAGMVEVIYEPSMRLVYMDAKSNQYPTSGSPTNAAYDAILAALAAIDAAKTARIQASGPTPQQRISAESDRRMAVGIVVNGEAFRCDDGSTLRMRDLSDGLAAAPANTTQTFRTQAGNMFTVNASQALTIANTQRQYRGQILAQSAVLQGTPPQGDVTQDVNWPAKPSITI